MHTLRLTAVAFAASALMAGAAGAESITVMNFANYMPEDLPKQFEEQTGISVDLVSVATNEDAMGRLIPTNGKGFDVVFVSNPFAEALNNLELLTSLDQAQLPNAQHLFPEATDLPYDPGNAYSMPYAWGTTGLCYRDDLVEIEPDSWGVLLDPPEELKGKITMFSTDRWLLAAGQLFNGFSVNDIEPANLDVVKETLIAAKKNLLAFDDATFYSKLVAGEAHLTQSWDVWCNYAIAENADVRYVIPKEGTDFYVDVMVIPSATEHSEAAHKFVNFILEPKNQLWVVENIYSKVPNKTSMEMVSAEMLEQFPNLAMTPAELAKHETFKDLGADLPAVSRVVTEIMAAR